jgi:hypothetical protein
VSQTLQPEEDLTEPLVVSDVEPAVGLSGLPFEYDLLAPLPGTSFDRECIWKGFCEDVSVSLCVAEDAICRLALQFGLSLPLLLGCSRGGDSLPHSVQECFELSAVQRGSARRQGH